MNASSSQPLSSSSQRPTTRRRRRSAPKPKLSSADSFVSAHIAMLESATLQVSIASDDDNNQQFIVTTQRSTSTTVSSQRYSFDELRQYKKKLLSVMQQGHLCHAECPWIYSYLKSYFPRKTSLTLSTEKRMLKRRDAIELCLSNVLQFVQSKHNHSCAVVTHDLAQELVCILFGYDLKEYSVQLLTPVDSDSIVRGTMDSFSSLSSLSTLSESDDEELQTCQLCNSSLHQHGTNSSSFDSDDDDHDHQLFLRSPVSVASHAAASSFGSRSSATYYTTTLGCGHRFHDECILPVLNNTQRCPTCDHLEIQ